MQTFNSQALFYIVCFVDITSLVVDAGLDEEDEEELASNENLDESKETTTSNNNKGSP